MKIVIIGGSFGGLTAEHELRRRLGARKQEMTLISKDRRFVFIPSLPWVVIGTKTLEDISFTTCGRSSGAPSRPPNGSGDDVGKGCWM